eukprot:CAMPEP_0168458538 /NCGR_PEP_ID=MMETSP0228-20121227/52434_1 /TAXON_ID=133427 /ORGANISM="Protoceratium reticulatum, Strain CCCM 535 (=CCMP 1889)" /LENGTH=47 /DNA_ID= /DNA_START= /DNA_END= /DNA_ORIENTATION=
MHSTRRPPWRPPVAADQRALDPRRRAHQGSQRAGDRHSGRPPGSRAS